MERSGDVGLLGVLPVAALHLRGGAVQGANRLALEALSRPGAPGHLGDLDDPLALIHEPDRQRLLAAAESVGPGVEGSLGVRVGAAPPYRFLEVHLGPHPDGGAIAVLHDVTERERHDASLAEVASGACFADADLRVTWVGNRVSASMGLAADDFVGKQLYDLVHPDDVDPTRELVRLAIERPGVRCAGKTRVSHPDQPDVWWPIVVHLVWRPEDPAICGFAVRIDLDLSAGSDHQPAEEVARALVTLGSSSETGSLHLNLDGRLLQRSARVREILHPVGTDGDKRWLELLSPEHRTEVDEHLDAARSGVPLPATEVSFAGQGTVVWIRLDVLPYRNTQGAVAGMFVNLTDSTTEHEAREALARVREELWILANHDALTGLPNRYRLTDDLRATLDTWLEVSDWSGRRPAVVVCDLDRFKVANDLYGHRVGDDVLVEAARRITAAVGGDGTAYRFGGDEFVVVCPATTATDLSGLGDRVTEAFAAPMVLDGLELDVGISVGGSLAERVDATDPDRLLLRADRAMYAVKAERRAARRSS